MTENCTRDCKNCTADCSVRDFRVALHPSSRVKKVYAIISGKGGVGKSMITALLAVQLQKMNLRTAILDADITGPSIPKMFGASGQIGGSKETGLIPVLSKSGIQLASATFLLKRDTDPVVWRGPVIAATVKQFWGSIYWDNVDVMLVDMPPGTGDVPLTIFQSLPLDGVIIITSPQKLVSMIVSKAVRMAEMMHVPIIGLIENMSYFACPGCDRKYPIFGESNIDSIVAEQGLKVLAKLPLDPQLTALADSGDIEAYDGDLLRGVAAGLVK